MQTIIVLICAVITVVAIPMSVACLIATIHEKRDNMRRLEDALYREYKSIGGNGYLMQLHTPNEYKPKHISPHTHNCINCGAPLKQGQDKCEYCGTEYKDDDDIY